MHSLTIVFGPSPVPWVLLFKSEEAAKAAWDKFDSAGMEAMKSALNKHVTITDDFGQQVKIQMPVHGIMLEDMEQSKLAHIEQGLHRARTQAKAQQMAAADPTLKMAASMQGPAMLQPGGFSGGPGNGAFRGQ